MDADELEECSSLIRGMNADAAILPTQHSLVNITSLLHQGIYIQDDASAASSHAAQGLDASSKWHKAEKSTNASRQAESHGPSLDHSANASHGSSSASISAQHAHKFPRDSGDHSHASRVSTMAIRPSGPVPLQRSARASACDCSTGQPCTLPCHRPRSRVIGDLCLLPCRLRLWLEHVLWEGKADLGEVYRLKGVVEVEGSRRLHMVQAVRELYDIVEGPDRQEDAAPLARLVLIGRDLQREKLADSFQSMVAEVSRGVQKDSLVQGHN